MELLSIWAAERAVELTLSDTQVTMKLSQELRDQVRDEIAADPDVNAPGWVGGLVRFVTGAAQKALGLSIAYPLEDIESVEYVDGALKFTYRKRHIPTFEVANVVVDGKTKPILAAFAPEDAEAFVAAFRKAKAQRG